MVDENIPKAWSCHHHASLYRCSWLFLWYSPHLIHEFWRTNLCLHVDLEMFGFIVHLFHSIKVKKKTLMFVFSAFYFFVQHFLSSINILQSENIRSVIYKIKQKTYNSHHLLVFRALEEEEEGEPIRTVPTNRKTNLQRAADVLWYDGRLDRSSLIQRGQRSPDT